MANIKILPEVLSNRIAAGEVVERPASVVRELVENSIDAKATDITVEVEKSGKTLIRVSDNGIGLSREDALLSIERYATSKIFTQEDLFKISTMGFRGEALPSIASVSKFTMVTRTGDNDTGTRIEISGGKLQDVSDTGAPVGTMVEVKQLFFNIPARKKFLKTDQTEIGHIADSISGLALGHPQIRFRLFSGSSLLKNYPASDSPLQRSISVLGNEVSKKLNEISYKDEKLIIKGFCSDPDIVKSSSSRIYLFVNRRLIYDRGLISAIFQGYHGRLMKGKYPLIVLYIDIDANEVDVNVHPAKKEVRFYDSRKIYQDVSAAVSRAFVIKQDSSTLAHDDSLQKKSFVFSLPDNNSFYDTSFPCRLDPEDRKNSDFAHCQNKSSNGIGENKNPVYQHEYGLIPGQGSGKIEQIVDSWGVSGKQYGPGQTRELIEDPFFIRPETRILGQIMGVYIVAETDKGLLLIDQHAAHERIIYESLKKKIALSKLTGQGLLVPEVVEFSHRESAVLQSMIPDLALLGIVVEPFGGTSFVIKSIPSIISEKDIKLILTGIIEKTLAEKDEFSKDRWLDECIMSMACRQAIKASHRMNITEMQNLVHELEKCENPGQCPHGRPTMIIVSSKEMEKWFKRTL